MRLKIPSFRGIEAFIAAAETGSMRSAARAMNLTVSAISHRIQVLESELGAQLFERRGQSLRLSALGSSYRNDILPGLNIIEKATDKLREVSGESRLRVATIPLFYSNWVTPRLSGFLEKFPKVQIELLSLDSKAADDADLTISPVFNEHARAGETKLFGWQSTPICHPDVIKRHHITEPADLLDVTLIDLDTPLDLWTSWFATAGLAHPVLHDRLIVDSQALMYDAALQKLGVAISTTFFGQRYIREGLVRPFDLVCETPGGMYINAYKTGELPIVTLFRTWLMEEIGLTASEIGAVRSAMR